MLIVNIRHLVNVRQECALLRGRELSVLPVLKNAWLRTTNGKIIDYGEMSSLPTYEDEIYDAKEASVLPAWCDSHTHLVFTGSREGEFVDKIRGLSYAEIAEKGGGIYHTSKLVRQAPAEKLYLIAQQRLQELMKLGTGAVEIKSGYALNVEGELKMLRVIQQLKKNSSIPVKSTFLGAHAIPPEYKNDRKKYIDLLLHEMLPAIAEEKLADYIDVFCENGFFSQAETEQICNAGKVLGLLPKIHANQLSCSGGVQAGIYVNALSVDHLESIGKEEMNLLGSGNAPIATLLPGAAFFLRMHYPPARALIEGNAAVALASDYNPGSSPSGNMNLVISLACIQMKMLPEEAINAATVNGAYAMGLENEAGSITKGKRANLIFTKPIPSLAYIPYHYGSPVIDRVMINGSFLK
jgi:imidazolonepropionase